MRPYILALCLPLIGVLSCGEDPPPPPEEPTIEEPTEPTEDALLLGPVLRPRLLPKNCSPKRIRVSVEIQNDANPGDIRWFIKNDKNQIKLKVRPGYYTEPNAVAVKSKCLKKGKYKFVIGDRRGDGFGDGGGYYRILVGDQEVVYNEEFKKRKKHYFEVELSVPDPDPGPDPDPDPDPGPDPDPDPDPGQGLTEREQQWLTEHNAYRRQEHTKYGVSFVPLKWSHKLADRAQVWADKLVHGHMVDGVLKSICSEDEDTRVNLYHDPDLEYGENLAANFGSGSWGKPADPHAVVFNRWGNSPGHNSQMLWRPSEYIGCADASLISDYQPGQGRNCHVTACRFARPGNCNRMHWSVDSSPCRPFCPPEGCF